MPRELALFIRSCVCCRRRFSESYRVYRYHSLTQQAVHTTGGSKAMEYQQQFILDFACRTRANLKYIETAEKNGEGVFEVTQLANSMLGLLVFPREHYMESIPKTPLDELTALGWPAVEVIRGSLPEDNLQELMRMLRNGIAHCNVEFLGTGIDIRGLRIWNKNKNSVVTWEAELSITDLRKIALKFVELIAGKDGSCE